MIAERYRGSMPVRIADTGDVNDPDRPLRVLLANGLEQRIKDIDGVMGAQADLVAIVPTLRLVMCVKG